MGAYPFAVWGTVVSSRVDDKGKAAVIAPRQRLLGWQCLWWRPRWSSTPMSDTESNVEVTKPEEMFIPLDLP